MMCPYCIKICSKCGKILVANTINFRKRKGGKYNLRAECRLCEKQYHYQYCKDNEEKVKEYSKSYYKQYNESNKDEVKKRNKKYYEENNERIKENSKKYYKENKDACKKANKQWYENNPDKVFNICQRRRLKEENQGNGITKDQWFEMMGFFNWECAYSGTQLNKDNRSIDHIVPLDKNGLNEIWNLVPMYLPYNSSKGTDNMLDWYKKQEFYSDERLAKIYEWQEYAMNKYKNN